MKTLTVITTTYNRAYCLNQVYDSLCRQTSGDFQWLIVDDGSGDNTKELVFSWKAAGKIEIEYYYKPNGGMHTARNAAYEKVNTELNVIIDSDDWMTDDAVEKIIRFWQKNKDNKYAGIIANNIDTEGKLIGKSLPDNVISCTTADLRNKYKINCDKKFIYRSELTKLYRYPEFPGEKFYPASYKFLMIDREYEMLLMNESVCVVDYNSDSMTFNKFAQYRMSPKGFAHYRNICISCVKRLDFRIRNMIHYIAESKFAGNKHYIKESCMPLLAFLCFPAGQALFIYLNNTNKNF